jgi:succinate dehydrogenase / fumarate reductase cytochrome b subunit
MAQLKQIRPSFFKLWELEFPVGAITSIGHRISGVLLVLGTPILIYLLDASLRSSQDFERVRAMLDTLPTKGLMLAMTWVFAHHFLAGVRHLLMDIDIGSSLSIGRQSAWLVNVGSVGVVLLMGVLLL